MSEQVELGLGAVIVLDTAGRACQAGVFVDGAPRALRFAEMTHGQAEALLPMLAEAMAEAGVAYPQVRAVVATAGPGSFTGLRVGLAAAQGLGLAIGCPVLAVSSFAAWAQGVAGPVRVALDTRRGDAFVQAFDAAGLPTGAPFLGAAELAAGAVGDLSGGVAPGLEAVFAAARNPAHRLPPLPIYLREADAVPQGGAPCA